MGEFVPRDFDVPHRLEMPQFVLEPLGPEHNEQDFAAWTSSMDHIIATRHIRSATHRMLHQVP